MKKLLFLCTMALSLLFAACPVQGSTDLVFDTDTFYAQKEKWEKSAPEAYCFKYFFSIAIPNEIIGNVSVTNNDHTATVKWGTSDRAITDGEYYLSSIEAVFDCIESAYKKSESQIENGDFDYISYKIEYDDKYGFPTYVSNYQTGGTKGTTSKEGIDGDNPSDIHLRIENFSVK